MLINSHHWKTIWLNQDNQSIEVIDQTKLPHKVEIKQIKTFVEAEEAIRTMVVRGAPLIGVTAVYGFMLGVIEDPSDNAINKYFNLLKSARPTAVNLQWGLQRVYKKIIGFEPKLRAEIALSEAKTIEKEDIEICSLIGEYGKSILIDIFKKKKKTINILTHCNAGWLATVDWGTALAPIYKAHRAGIDLHVWVDETRPRNQGASLTSFELKNEGIPHTVIVDNAGGYLMQDKLVDAVIVGSDRTTRTGDVCNKIGTYLKALAAKDNDIPFYVALPCSTIDWSLTNGIRDIPIEIRSEREVSHIIGKRNDGSVESIQLIPDGCASFNPGFDVTPARFVTSLITEKGISKATEQDIKAVCCKSRYI